MGAEENGRSAAGRYKGRTMAQKDRLDQIRQTIQQERKVMVSQLSRDLKVTEETIRRDLEKLEKSGFLTRIHGGAVLNAERVSENIDYPMRVLHNHQEKEIMGRLAASIIPDRATISTDASSTVMEAVRLLKDRPEITVLTNSVQIIRELSQAPLTIVSTGGMVNKSTFSMQGKVVRKVLADYYVDIALISCKALQLGGGIFDSNEEEGELKKLMAERGQKIILLADHSKFDRVAFVKILELDALDILVTDREPSQEWRELCREKGIRLLYPGVESPAEP